MNGKQFVVIAGNMPEELKNNIKKQGFVPLDSCKVNELDTPVCFHPDLQIIKLQNVCYTAKNCYFHYRDLFDKNGVKSELFAVENNVFSPYPNDCLLNVTVLENCILKGKTTPCLPEFSDFKIIECNQGYAGCSALKLSDSAVITDDATVFKALKLNGTDCLYLPKRKVYLEGFDCGFIGGAGFSFNNRVYFFGCLEQFEYFDEISDFCAAHGFETVSLSDKKLTDYGKAVVIF